MNTIKNVLCIAAILLIGVLPHTVYPESIWTSTYGEKIFNSVMPSRCDYFTSGVFAGVKEPWEVRPQFSMGTQVVYEYILNTNDKGEEKLYLENRYIILDFPPYGTEDEPLTCIKGIYSDICLSCSSPTFFPPPSL